MKEKSKIVCLCGSTKFPERFREVALQEALHYCCKKNPQFRRKTYDKEAGMIVKPKSQHSFNSLT